MKNPWVTSLAVTAFAVAASLWIWLGPWLPANPLLPLVLVGGVLPFLVALLSPRIPLFLAMLPFLIAYVSDGQVDPNGLMVGLGACWVSAAVGILLQRMWRVMNA